MADDDLADEMPSLVRNDESDDDDDDDDDEGGAGYGMDYMMEQPDRVSTQGPATVSHPVLSKSNPAGEYFYPSFNQQTNLASLQTNFSMMQGSGNTRLDNFSMMQADYTKLREKPGDVPDMYSKRAYPVLEENNPYTKNPFMKDYDSSSSIRSHAASSTVGHSMVPDNASSVTSGEKRPSDEKQSNVTLRETGASDEYNSSAVKQNYPAIGQIGSKSVQSLRQSNPTSGQNESTFGGISMYDQQDSVGKMNPHTTQSDKYESSFSSSVKQSVPASTGEIHRLEPGLRSDHHSVSTGETEQPMYNITQSVDTSCREYNPKTKKAIVNPNERGTPDYRNLSPSLTAMKETSGKHFLDQDSEVSERKRQRCDEEVQQSQPLSLIPATDQNDSFLLDQLMQKCNDLSNQAVGQSPSDSAMHDRKLLAETCESKLTRGSDHTLRYTARETAFPKSGAGPKNQENIERKRVTEMAQKCDVMPVDEEDRNVLRTKELDQLSTDEQDVRLSKELKQDQNLLSAHRYLTSGEIGGRSKEKQMKCDEMKSLVGKSSKSDSLASEKKLNHEQIDEQDDEISFHSIHRKQQRHNPRDSQHDEETGPFQNRLEQQKKNLCQQQKDLGQHQKDLGQQQKNLGHQQKDLGQQQKDLGQQQKDLGQQQKLLEEQHHVQQEQQLKLKGQSNSEHHKQLDILKRQQDEQKSPDLDQQQKQDMQKDKEPDEKSKQLDQKVKQLDQQLLNQPFDLLEQPDQQLKQPDQQLKQPDQQLKQPNQQLKHPDQQLKHPDQQLNQPDQQLKQPDQQLKQPDQQRKQPDEQLKQQDQQLKHPDEQLKQPHQQLKQPDQQLKQSDQQLKQLDQQLKQPDQLVLDESLHEKLEEFRRRSSEIRDTKQKEDIVLDKRMIMLMMLKEPRLSMKHSLLGRKNFSQNQSQLIECATFGQIGRIQPFSLSISTNCLLVMDFHCHMKMSEVVGYVAGKWDSTTQQLNITHAFPCLVRTSDKEKTYIIEDNIRRSIDDQGLVLGGWYHSHPLYQSDPSLRDIEAQMEYQYLLKGSPNTLQPCFAAIISPFFSRSTGRISDTQFFYVVPPIEEHKILKTSAYNVLISRVQMFVQTKLLDYGIPVTLQYNLRMESSLREEMYDELQNMVKFYKDEVDYSPFSSNWEKSTTVRQKFQELIARNCPGCVIDKRLAEIISTL